MMKHTTTLRPALAAIAAVLASSATPLLAQEIAPQPALQAPALQAQATAPVAQPAITAPPVVATQPSATPANAPIQMAPLSPVVQPTPAPAPAPIEAAPAPAPRAAPKPVAHISAAKAAPAPLPVASTPVETAPVPVVVAPAAIAPAQSAPAAIATAQPTPAPAPTNDPTPWAVLAGAAALIGIGGIFALRRRKPIARTAAIGPVETPVEPNTDPVTPVAPAPETVSRWTDVRTTKPTSLNAMIAQSPSPENPFLTRKNRLRRAAFLIHQQANADRQPVRADSPTSIAIPAPTPATATPRPAPVYDFGRGITVRRGFKPLTS